MIQSERIESDLKAIAECTATPGAGASRPTFSPEWRKARDYVAGQLESCGCKVRIDALGNLHARPRALDWSAPAWLSGSHVDTVPNGGDYDGVVGVVVALELLRAADDDQRNDFPLELVIFAEEEGTTFGVGMAGSQAWVGNLSVERLRGIKNAGGEDYITAGTPHGIRVDRIGDDLIDPRTIKGMLEVHIEQGAGLWRSGNALAVVDAIAGRRQYHLRLEGRANHAGSTAMPDRLDALTAAAEIVLALEALPETLSPRAVATVGKLVVRPNAINVIPGEVELTIDFRSPEAAILDEGDGQISELVRGIAERRGVSFQLDSMEIHPPEVLDPQLCDRIRDAAERSGLGAIPTTASGALHDAAILAPFVPTVMLFVASRDGVSHNAAESSRIEDITAATRTLWEMLTNDS